jgi:hypothetical protein
MLKTFLYSREVEEVSLHFTTSLFLSEHTKNTKYSYTSKF